MGPNGGVRGAEHIGCWGNWGSESVGSTAHRDLDTDSRGAWSESQVQGIHRR